MRNSTRKAHACAGTTREIFDVIVVGAGNAAILPPRSRRGTRRRSRARVGKSFSLKLRGGNTRFSGGLFRCTYNSVDDLMPIVRDHDDPATVTLDPYTSADYRRDMDRVTGGRTDPELSALLIEQSHDTVRWMADLGIPWEFNRAVGAVTIPGSSRVKLPAGGALRVKGEGVILSSAWFRIAEEAGIDIAYETYAQRLITGQDGASWRRSARTRGLKLSCRALVLASGGFRPTRKCAPLSRSTLESGESARHKL
jgi:tricarballylate dehydrogenase